MCGETSISEDEGYRTACSFPFPQLSFDEDNQISGTPVQSLLEALDPMLSTARARQSGQLRSRLNQLVIILADGNINETQSLPAIIRELTSKTGVLFVFIILDNPKMSLLERKVCILNAVRWSVPDAVDYLTHLSSLFLQSFSFTGGKLEEHMYMHSFPFPYYILVRDTKSLPNTLASLLAQWFQLQNAH